MDDRLLTFLQNQINAEFYSAYMYLSMSSWCEEQEGIKGFANWMRVQAQEELFHALFMHDYVIRRGKPSHMKSISEPPSSWKDPLDMFESVLAHEQKVTKSINEIASVAMECNDHATYQFIMRFVDEQVEEEESVSDIIGKLKFYKGNTHILYDLDKELATRVYTQPNW